jgi:hypothetical protein
MPGERWLSIRRTTPAKKFSTRRGAETAIEALKSGSRQENGGVFAPL